MIIGFIKTLVILFAFMAFIGLITTMFVQAVVFIARAIEEGRKKDGEKDGDI